MNRLASLYRLYLASVLTLAVIAAGGCTRTISLADAHPELKNHSAVKPVDRPERKGWMERHNAMNARVQQGDADLIFVGDSITQGWEKTGREVWEKYYGRRKAVNLGIGGDRTEHVLWRLENGNIRGISPKVAVVMIGTNNSAGNTPEEIADGVMVICKKLRKELPSTKILLLAIFPRGERPADERRAVNTKTNAILAKVRDGRMIYYLDIGDQFLQPDGTLTKEIMPDFLHPSPKGYEIWAKAMEPKLAELLGEKR